jgi:hypothetical protein
MLGMRNKAIKTSNVHLDMSASKAVVIDGGCASCAGGVLQWIKSRPLAMMDHV